MTSFETEFDRYFNNSIDVFRRTGSTEELYSYIAAISDADYRNRTFGKVAAFLAERAALAEALRFCDAIDQPLECADAYFDLGVVLAKSGSIQAAKDALRKAVNVAEELVGRSYDTGAVWLQVSSELQQLGEDDEALDLLRRAVALIRANPQDFESGKTLRGCARLLAKWNRLGEAVEVAESISLPQLRAATLEEIHDRGQWPVHPRGDTR